MTTGALYVVATPIGNLEDLSERARSALDAADAILAEDTRVSRRLLERHGLKKPLISVHRFNEARRMQRLLERLGAGETLALVTDGGTPGVSDPGVRLVEAAHRAGARVVPIPGPSAVSTALSAAGFPADRFVFCGFLPPRAAARRRALASFAAIGETLVLFEAPHRLIESLGDMLRILGDRDAALCRELTKRHEEIVRAPLEELLELVSARERVRGEITLVVAGGPARVAEREVDRQLLASWRDALSKEQDDSRRALRRLAREMGVTRSELKRRLDAAGS